MNTTNAFGNASAAVATLVSSTWSQEGESKNLTSILQTTPNNPSTTAQSFTTISPRSHEWQASLTEMMVEEMRKVEARVQALAAVKRAADAFEAMKREIAAAEEGREGDEVEEERRDSVRELFPEKIAARESEEGRK